MRFISTKMHGVMDYIYGLLLIASPWLFNFADGGAKQWVPVVVGVMVLLMSVMTDYEAGLTQVIPMSGHLTMDVIAGIFLAASPWIFGFADEVSTPHIVLGIISILTGLCTERTPHNRTAHSHRDLSHA